jgi:hypothetical protein
MIPQFFDSMGPLKTNVRLGRIFHQDAVKIHCSHDSSKSPSLLYTLTNMSNMSGLRS